MKNKVMLITGSSKGIGRSLVEYYSRTHIVVGCSRGSSTYSHPNYTHLICDISDASRVRNLILEINKLFPRIDILVNKSLKKGQNINLYVNDKIYENNILLKQEVNK
jgi:3-oxoacyl-[acyl-carrier protein] reductase